MSLYSLLTAIVSPITSTVAKVSTNKAEVKKRRIQAVRDAQSDEAAWEAIQAENSRVSWRDEWFTILLSVPLIGSFIPSLVPYIEEGFRVLDGMPEDYRFWLTVAILSSFGIRALKK